MWKLVIEDDEGKRTVVPLTRDDYSIGRKEGNTIRLTERNVSRSHAKIRKMTNGASAPERVHYLLEDQESYNGVYVNGIRVASAQDLGHGDLVQIGDYRIVLQDDSVIEAPPPSQPDPKATLPPGGQGRASLLMERPNRFVMLAGPTPGAEYPLEGERLTVGRAEDASISVNHNSVSRLHCEIHSLGDGRFEIVDKGSSNGVRVNTAELRRGIIEPGDVIELGDVKFKFVGAGQIFLPGVNDSQQLSAIGDRVAGSRRGAGVLPYVVFGAVIAVVAVGIWAFTRPRPEPVVIQPVGNVTPPDPAQQSLDDAKHLCDTGDCDTAHEKITNEIPPSSPLRETADFKGIQIRWAEVMLTRAENETDVGKKRALLGEVAGDPTVDAGHRKRAADKLQLLDQAAPTPSQLPSATPKDAAVVALPDKIAPVAVPAPAPRRPAAYSPDGAQVQQTPAPAPPPKAPSGTDVHTLLLQDTPSSIAAARAILEPKVFGNRATAEEIRMLKTICKSQHDEVCVEKCKSLLGQ
jgi:pSer/pThr/pTyr-binding forkhead associated (FHA) protein